MTTYILSRSKCSSSQCSNWERRKQVVNNINNLISSIADCFKNDTYESTGCNKHNSMRKQIYQALYSASITVCMAFCTALSPFIYDIVILWLCKWQLTYWVGVNAAVHSVAVGKEDNKWLTISTTYSILFWEWYIRIYRMQYKNLQDVITF